MTDWTPRTLEIPLAFLPGGPFTAEIYRDADDAAEHPDKVTIEKLAVTKSSTLTLKLAPGGGAAVRIAPAN